MKKSYLTRVMLLVIFILLALTLNVQAATTPGLEDVYPGREYFFAKGTPITISARTDSQPGATITWEGGSLNVGPDAYIFGGMHNDDTAVTSSITMNGGNVKHIAGGGLHLSNTTTSNVTINGGNVNYVAGGGVGSGATIGQKCTAPTCDGFAQESDATQAKCKTGTTNVTVTGGTVTCVYGGGLSGVTKTTAANVKMSGGSVEYVVGGVSNGYTGTANVKVTGGTATYVQSVNRGTMDSANMSVTGGNVTNLFVGGENDSSVTGTINDVKLTVSENATVGTLSYGYNGGTDIDPTTGNITAEDVKVSGNANVGNKDALANTVTTTYAVTIDGKVYTLEAGKTIKDIPGYDALITRDGSDFAGFVSNGTMFDPNTVINANVEMKTAFAPKAAPASPAQSAPTVVEAEKDNTPKTGIDNLSAYATIIAMISLMGIIIIKK